MNNINMEETNKVDELMREIIVENNEYYPNCHHDPELIAEAYENISHNVKIIDDSIATRTDLTESQKNVIYREATKCGKIQEISFWKINWTMTPEDYEKRMLYGRVFDHPKKN